MLIPRKRIIGLPRSCVVTRRHRKAVGDRRGCIKMGAIGKAEASRRVEAGLGPSRDGNVARESVPPQDVS